MPRPIMVSRAWRLSKRILSWPSACSKKPASASRSRRCARGRWYIWAGSPMRPAIATRRLSIIRKPSRWRAPRRLRIRQPNRERSGVYKNQIKKESFMNRIIISGALALAIGLPGLMAQPKAKSKAEGEALQAMFAAQTADARIAAAENVLTKFADTDFKATAYYFEAVSYQQKGDYEHSVVFGERAVEADQ